jgi:hypothetical protein
VVQRKLWKALDVQYVGALLVEKMDTGERSIFFLRNLYAPNAMKKGRPLGFRIWNFRVCEAKVEMDVLQMASLELGFYGELLAKEGEQRT